MPAPPTSTLPDSEIDQLHELALRLATEAGTLIRDGREQATREVSTKTTRADVVTTMDRACEIFLRTEIAAQRPDDGVYGEEHDEQTGTSGVRWVIDPIDGTVNYLYGLADYAVSIAVEIGGEIVAGVVHKPQTAETFSARRGAGAFLNGERLHSSAPDALDVTLLATGFGYAAARRRQQGEVVAELLGHVRDIRRMGSAALDLCNAAAGRVDGYYEWGVHLWDVAAGALIASEAGLDVRLPEHEEGLVTAVAPSVSDEVNALVRSLIRPQWQVPS
ncbi:inositol monophosphatase [Epidermidibacterium keratini]|uniref:Inositol-1-monophosphatase n=1 Tax=Epidermidibacterium keratini TaxID=1891644 RepID=A0A7L4YRV7_9ACTN|nr:inositol monophosphatase family protein [Epidermidibacterium keratini]QHC01955.1 inositol monophosphatase [Epidermidibacterium keratini]